MRRGEICQTGWSFDSDGSYTGKLPEDMTRKRIQGAKMIQLSGFVSIYPIIEEQIISLNEYIASFEFHTTER